MINTRNYTAIIRNSARAPAIRHQRQRYHSNLTNILTELKKPKLIKVMERKKLVSFQLGSNSKEIDAKVQMGIQK